MKDYKPVLNIWKKDKDGMYWAETDDVLQAVINSPRSSSEIKDRIGAEKYFEIMHSKSMYLSQIYSFEIAIKVYRPKWQYAMDRD